MLQSGPWSFSSHLLILRQCEPYGRVTHDVIIEIASKLGTVVEVKLEDKGNSTG